MKWELSIYQGREHAHHSKVQQRLALLDAPQCNAGKCQEGTNKWLVCQKDFQYSKLSNHKEWVLFVFPKEMGKFCAPK